ncbi:transglycosylase family protein [Streptomyces tremellae]|uniref:Resuscitation-promoting factor protein RpfC n=1 Tax=Streptomyces tremellae TaxID=1124239 RepID=A0ABP7ET48_9ACTN
MSGNGRHRRPRQAPAIVVAAGVTGSALAIPLLASASASAASTSTWDKVAACESGGQWDANLSNGYYGGLQISQDTWDQYGGSQYASRPDLASKAQQISVAEKILTDQGSQTWADCADSAGLPQTTPSGGDDDGGTLGDVVGGLLGGSDDSATPDPSASPTTGDTATPDPSASTDPGDAPAASDDAPDPSATPSDGASPDAPAHGSTPSHATPSSGGKHRATPPAEQGDDDGLPSGVSRDNDGGVLPPTGGVGSVGNADRPGVVRDVIRIPFAPRYTGGDAQALWQLPSQDPARATGEPADSASPAATGAPAPGATAGKHRGAPPATHASGTSAQKSKAGRHAASGDTSSADSATAHRPGARYTVHAGDSLSGIAASQGVKGGWHALYEANKTALGSDPNHIVPGQTLELGAN